MNTTRMEIRPIGKENRKRGSRVAVAASVTISSALGAFSQSGALASDNVTDNHMPPPRRDPLGQSSDWGFSVYGGSFGTLVLRDITLDGNTFQDSPSVDKNYFVPMAAVGMSVGNRRFQASFSYIFLGKEFEGQQQMKSLARSPSAISSKASGSNREKDMNQVDRSNENT